MKTCPWMDYNGILSTDLWFMIKLLIWLPASLVFVWNDRSSFQWSSRVSFFTSFSSEVIAAVHKPFSLQERTKFILMSVSAQSTWGVKVLLWTNRKYSLCSDETECLTRLGSKRSSWEDLFLFFLFYFIYNLFIFNEPNVVQFV